ncbi:hypothetical protein C8R45DRAFT_461380 [Mycena sanguinolenta]|nr:hypothetical protein C8R45DRAFT_461380 [Mycena sanguinolenta]
MVISSAAQDAIPSNGSISSTYELQPEFLRLESSIRALSTAIHLVQGQCQFPVLDSHEVEVGITEKDRTRAYGHLATLLTTSPLGRQTVAVTGGSSPRGFYINATEIVVEDKHGSQEINFNEPMVLKLNVILPSKKTLKQLAEDRPAVTLVEHAADVFQALRLASQNLYAADQRLLESFIMKRCHREITRRLKVAVELMDPPLHDVLKSWELQCGDEVKEEWFMIPYPLILIESSCIPHRRASQWPDHFEFLFNRDTFPLWKNFFVSLLRVALSTVTALRPARRGSATDAILSLHFLRLFLSFGPARTILTVSSLQSTLETLLHRDHKYSDVRDRTVVSIILQRLDDIVAYDAAITSLTARRSTVTSILRQSLPRVHIITAHGTASTTSKSMDSISHIMRSTIVPALDLSQADRNMMEALITEHLSVTEFTGAVHCEASMMGIACAFSNVPDVERSNTEAFFDAFETSSNTIGVVGQPCQICHWLSEGLLLPNGYFNLKGSHGRTVPWSPPRFGIPLSVLGNLEAELLELLEDLTLHWLKNLPENLDPKKTARNDNTEIDT